MSHAALPEVFLARHGETAWAISGQHTGLTDIPLTDRGERNAKSLGERLAGLEFAEIRTSPLQRAMKTCALAGFEGRARRDPDLVRGYCRASWPWAATYALRLAVLVPLWAADLAVALGVAQLLLTWPLIAACLLVSWPLVRSALPPGHPGPRHPVHEQAHSDTPRE